MAADTECPSGLWDEYLGTAIPVKEFKDCSNTNECAHCGMLLGILTHTKPSWLADDDGHRDLSIVIKPRERWVFNTNLALPNSKGSGSIRLLDDGQQIDSVQLYRPITDVQKLSLINWDRYEKILFGESLDIAASSDSTLAFERASQWLKDCTDNHACYTDDQQVFVPHRMLRIGESDTVSSVQLVEHSAISPSPYVALSYCWGKDTSGVLTTTKDRYASHLQGIPVLSLPKTVQDAITVCRRLGIFLLWVDALCIVQDDEQDWRREAEKMIDIYSNSSLTISASEPGSCKQGFLGPQRFGSSEWQHAIPVKVPSGLGGPTDHLLCRDSQMERPKLFSLDSRGWCLQESVMPRRRLVFDGCELSWNCLEKILCECGHLDEDACGVYPHLRTGTDGDEEEDDEDEPSPYAKLHMEWMDFVEEYSQRALTKSSDKLVAISGIVRLFQRRFADAKSKDAKKDEQILGLFRNRAVTMPCTSPTISDSYLAGLWGDCIIPNLAWTVDHPQLEKSGRTQHTRIEEYVAPSWSWASIDGPVTFRHMEISVGAWNEQVKPELVCDVVVKEVSCTPMTTDNPHGAIKSSALRISGSLIPVELAILHEGDAVGAPQYFWYRRMAMVGEGPIPSRRQCFARTPRLQCWRVFLDVERLPTLEKASPLADCWSHPRHPDSNGCGCSFNSETEYACLRIMTYKAEDAYKRGNVPTIVLFLLLKRLPGSTQTYQRVGLGLWNKDEGVQEAPRNGGDYDMFVDATDQEIIIV